MLILIELILYNKHENDNELVPPHEEILNPHIFLKQRVCWRARGLIVRSLPEFVKWSPWRRYCNCHWWRWMHTRIWRRSYNHEPEHISLYWYSCRPEFLTSTRIINYKVNLDSNLSPHIWLKMYPIMLNYLTRYLGITRWT